MKIITINPFAVVWIGLSIFLIFKREIDWWIPALIFLSHVELNIKFHLR